MASAASATYFACEIPHTGLSVHLGADVAQRVGLEVTEGYKAVPKRGLEVGGLLLGKVQNDGTLVVIDGIEPLPCEHREGPSYLLSEKDRQLLEDRMAQWKAAARELRVVGFYRSHTRPGFALTETDRALMAECCLDPGGIFLLMKPSHSQPIAGALFAGEGLASQSTEFPLHPGELAKALPLVEAAPPRLEPAPVPALPVPALPQLRRPRLSVERVTQGCAEPLERAKPEPPATPPIPPVVGTRRKPRLAGLVLAVILIADTGLLGFLAWRAAQPGQASPPANSMAFDAVWLDGSLHLRWNGKAPVIQQALRGVVWITDGQQRQRLDLDAQQLTQGSMRYWPSSKDVDLRLEVFLPKESASESVRAVNIPIPVAQNLTAPKLESRQGDEGSPEKAPGVVSVEGQPLPAAPPSGSPGVQPAGTRPFATVDTEVMKLRLGNAAHAVAPTARRPVIPVVPPALRRLKEEVRVDVKVEVDPSGKVRRADLFSRRTRATRGLENLALSASRRWLFEPARVGGRKVSSQLILHYRFGSPTAEKASN